MPWLLSVKTTIFDLPRRLVARSVTSAVVEMVGAGWFFWALHEVWAPLPGLIGGPLAVVVGAAIDRPKPGASEG